MMVIDLSACDILTMSNGGESSVVSKIGLDEILKL